MNTLGLYQSDWSKAPPHAHAYHVKTTREQGHYHLIEGFTQPANGSNTDQHTHYFTGITSFDNGHFHRYYGISGPAIPLADGTHYHELEETTYLAYNKPIKIQYGGVVYSPGDDGRKTHRHALKGKTGEIVGNEPFGW